MAGTIYHLGCGEEWIGLTTFVDHGPNWRTPEWRNYSGLSSTGIGQGLRDKEWLLRGPEGSFGARVTKVQQIGGIWKVYLSQISPLIPDSRCFDTMSSYEKAERSGNFQHFPPSLPLRGNLHS